MKRWFALSLVTLLIWSPSVAQGQDSGPYISAIYYQCQIPGQDRADEIMRTVIAPVYDKHLAAGHISAWGWLGHRSGGAWRRASYFTAETLDGLLDMQDAIIQELRSSNRKAMQELNTICPTHDDYIWTPAFRPAQPGVQTRTPASLATYYECDISRQAEADSVVNASLAPIFNRHMQAGHIRSWSWLSHVFGGKYRRLLVLDGPSHKQVMGGLMAIINDLEAEQSAALSRFSGICSSHQDYMWDVLMSKP